MTATPFMFSLLSNSRICRHFSQLPRLFTFTESPSSCTWCAPLVSFSYYVHAPILRVSSHNTGPRGLLLFHRYEAIPKDQKPKLARSDIHNCSTSIAKRSHEKKKQLSHYYKCKYFWANGANMPAGCHIYWLSADRPWPLPHAPLHQTAEPLPPMSIQSGLNSRFA